MRLHRSLLMSLPLWLVCSTATAQWYEPSPRAALIEQPLVEIGVSLQAQTLPNGLQLDGQLLEWPSALQLHSGPGEAEQGLVAVAPGLRLALAQDAGGIALAINSHRLQEPFRLHLEVLALDRLTLPEISWRWRWGGSVVYSQADDCQPTQDLDRKPRYDEADCRRWYAQQLQYRQQLASEFVRRFEIGPEGLVLDPDASRASYLPQRPTSLPRMSQARPDWLEVLIPWDALPATDTLQLDQLFLRVRLCRLRQDGSTLASCVFLLGRGADSSDADAAPQGEGFPALLGGVFDRLQLSQPRRYRITPCDLPLRGDIRPGLGDHQPGYLLPGAQDVVRALFSLHEPALSYQDRPDGLSPTVHLSRFSWQELGEDEYLCFPGPVWRRGALRLEPEAMALEPPGWEDSPQHAVHPLDESALLILRGPYQDISAHSGQGQCGACLLTRFHAWYLDRATPALHPAFSYEFRDDQSEGVVPRIDYLPELRQIEIEERECRWQQASDASTDAAGDDDWIEHCSVTQIRWCLTEGSIAFEECGRSVHSVDREAGSDTH